VGAHRGTPIPKLGEQIPLAVVLKHERERVVKVTPEHDLVVVPLGEVSRGCVPYNGVPSVPIHHLKEEVVNVTLGNKERVCDETSIVDVINVCSREDRIRY
jgi:hypothetical protein